jgi:hypothetical protein
LALKENKENRVSEETMVLMELKDPMDQQVRKDRKG